MREKSIGDEEDRVGVDWNKDQDRKKEQKRGEMKTWMMKVNENGRTKKKTIKRGGDSINEFESERFQRKLSNLPQNPVNDEDEVARDLFDGENEEQIEENRRRESRNQPGYDQDELINIMAMNKHEDEEGPNNNLADYLLDTKNDEKSFLPSTNNRDYSQDNIKNKKPTQKLQKELSIEKSIIEQKKLINNRRNDSQKVSTGGLAGQNIYKNADAIQNKLLENSRNSPETPNLGSPIKESKNPLRSEGSAYWSKEAPSTENQQLKEKLQEYEDIIQRQSVEIKLLKKQLDSQSQEFPKFLDRARKSPRSSGFIQKKAEGSFLKKESDLFKKDDMDFWKMAEENNSKEPQKLEDIASLKDLWILNMDSGAALYNNLSGKKIQGVKPNPLNKYDYQGRNSKSRVLPKIQTKPNLLRK